MTSAQKAQAAMTPAQRAKAADKAATAWNARHEVGTKVTRYALINPLREGTETTTRSHAWVMGGHSAVVMVAGVAGAVLLESVVPVVTP